MLRPLNTAWLRLTKWPDGVLEILRPLVSGRSRGDAATERQSTERDAQPGAVQIISSCR
jgi:hypothetical protein